MIDDRLAFFIEYRIHSDNFGIYVVTRDASGHVNGVAVNMELVARTPEQRGTGFPPPLIETDGYTLRGLMDELWKVGIRPSGQQQTDKEREAYLAHIADLRAIAMHATGVK